MEKFTVDLDKVLDEFEFNEEQAVRHALQHYKREDLPATKYQKPHFKPINIADADFSPCIETTMTYPNYHQKHSQEPINMLIKTDSVTNNFKINEVKLPVLTDLTEVELESNNIDIVGMDLCDCNYSQEENFSVLDDKVSSNNSFESGGLTLEKNLESHSEININSNEMENESITEKEKEDNNSDQTIIQSNSVDKSNIKLSENEVTGEISIEKEENENVCNLGGEVKSQNNQEPQKNKPDLIENEVIDANSSQEKEVKKLPDLTVDVIQEKPNKRDTVKVDSLDLIQNDVEQVKDKNLISDLETNCRLESQAESEDQSKAKENSDAEKDTTNCQSNPELESGLTLSKIESSQSETETSEPQVDAEEVIEVTEIKPIQFETQLDITDEELQKYLKELEEEEEKEEKKKQEHESKPIRPHTLNISKSKQTESNASAGQTPLPTSEELKALGSDEENNGSESKAESDKEALEAVEELENLLESTTATPSSSEPPLTIGERRLGKVSPFWMPDHLASSCMECESKFTVIKRRHHCRACGRILCSKCCGMRASLEYLQNQEQRVCDTCFRTLAKVLMYELQSESETETSPRRRPNPNNPMEYCSTVPPPLQVCSSSSQPPPSVLVPVGVLKREGTNKVKEAPKQVMFSDGIRPGGDLTELDGSGDHRHPFRKLGRSSKRAGTPPGNASLSPSIMLPPIDPVSQSFIVEKSLPPIYINNKGETIYEENWPLSKIMEKLKDPDSPPLQFAINRNLVASIKIVKLDCCMKETCWVICTKGMGCVGQDEILVLLTLNGENDENLPKEVLLQFHYIYQEAARGNTVNELGYWCVKESSFLDSKHHGGFLFIRPTFQCLNRIEIPPPPFLVGVLIHKLEIPWARVFPFRLMLRLGAEFRYYPCPLVSVRFREPVYYEIGHTIINLLADFRNLSYTIPSVRGLRIHMETTQTSILIPKNRYDQVIRALNNSNEPVLALAGNFSPEADAHLVCMQSKGNEVTYSTHAININDKPRKVTGASFIVLNGALKTTSGVAAKSSIVEDGLMVQVPSETMTKLRTKLRNMEDWSVCCGPIEGKNTEEVVRIIWCEDDKNFNVGVKSVIDNMALDGVPSIRVHSGKDYMGNSKFIRWTQVFIIKCEDGATSAKLGDPLEVNKLSESLARATCLALTKLLELLAASGLTVLAVRATIDQENVGYEAGSNGEKLAPIYMNSLDNELIPVLHKAASLNDSVAVLELIFHIMDQ